MAVIDFTPQPNTPFQFQATLDGSVYTVIVKWSLFGRRYYVDVLTLQGVRVVFIAMVGSPIGYDINLVKGYFQTSSLVWRPSSNQFEISP